MEFESQLINLFNEKKNLSPKTVSLYLRNLRILNDDDKLKNLNFLNNVETILNKLNNYKENTKRIYLISITSTLSLFKDTKKYKKLYDKYFTLMKNKNDELRDVPTNQMNENQKESWISWDDVLNKYNEIKNKVLLSIKNKTIADKHDKYLLPFIVLALYAHEENEVRRNADYQYMYVINKYSETYPDDKNYLDLTNKVFIFNVFKTSKSKGQQVIKISEPLFNDIMLYLNNYPLNNNIKNIKKDKTPIPLLVNKDGSVLSQVNSITRILNKLFGSNVGSSMLRHIFITYKLGPTLNKLEMIASNMGHSMQMQKDYLKNTNEIIV
jgi:hypothetical protein